MSSLIKGNFDTKKQVEDRKTEDESLEARFESEALKKLGGSVAYVAKAKVTWELDEDDK